MLKYNRRHIEDAKKFYKKASSNKDLAYVVIGICLLLVIIAVI